MARPLRIEFPGAVYHITARGNNRQDLFIDNQDRELFLQVLEKIAFRFQLVVNAYCLMGNRYHLLPETPEGKWGQILSKLMELMGSDLES